jgi:hypothetical protein
MKTFKLVASNVIGGVPLVNGTPTFLSWTAPNDGLMRWAFIAAYLHASSTMTGGELGNGFTDPQGNTVSDTVFVPGSQSSGFSQWQTNLVPIQAGTAVTVFQATALTAGAAQAWGGIWVSPSA